MTNSRLYGTALLGLLLLTGCSSPADKQPDNQGSYCLNGSRENNYRCDLPASSTAAPVVSAPTAEEIDEAWMYTKLAELRAWFDAQRHSLDTPSPEANDNDWQTLQLGGFKNDNNVGRLQQALLDKGYETFTRHKGEMTIIYVGREQDRSQLALLQAALLEELGLLGMIVTFPEE